VNADLCKSCDTALVARAGAPPDVEMLTKSGTAALEARAGAPPDVEMLTKSGTATLEARAGAPSDVEMLTKSGTAAPEARAGAPSDVEMLTKSGTAALEARAGAPPETGVLNAEHTIASSLEQLSVDGDIHDKEASNDSWECKTAEPDEPTPCVNTKGAVETLRDRKNVVKVGYHQGGTYHPVDTHGAPRCNPGPLLHRFEQRFDCQYLRPPGNACFRAASFFTGPGVMDEAARRGKLRVVCAAEKNKSLHADYYANTGVSPYGSNAELLRDIPDDIDVYLFGSNCRSVSRAGLKKMLGQTDDWVEFDRVVTHMGSSSVKACLYECSSDLVNDYACERTLHHVLNAFDAAGFEVKYDVACPSFFGWGVTRLRAIFVCVRKRVAAMAGFRHAALQVITEGPIGRHAVQKRCVADYLERPRGGLAGPGVVNFEEWRLARLVDHGEAWAIDWFPPYDTKAKRDAIRRDVTVARRQPLTLGYANLVDGPKSTRTGHKVGSVYGTLHGITNTGVASGPGRNCALYYDPLTGQVETPGDDALAKLWGVEGLRGMSLKNLGQTAHPAVTTANLQLITLLLDKYYHTSEDIPRVPMISFETVYDVYTPEGLGRVAAWVTEASRWRARVLRQPQRNYKVPAPLILGDECVQFWARGRCFDLRPCSEGKPPERLERSGKAEHDIWLLGLPFMEDYDDQEANAVDLTGFSTGSNPTAQVVLHMNNQSFVAHEELAMPDIQLELDRGWLTLHATIPFFPYYMMPFFMVEQGEKWRRIHNFSKEARGRSINQQRTDYSKAKFSLVQHIALREQLFDLACKVRLMRSWGWSVRIGLFIVDLWKAYNQMANDKRQLWYNGFGLFRPDRREDFMFGTNLRTGFGDEDTPQAFGGKVTRAANYSIDQSLDRSGEEYRLQALWRNHVPDAQELPDGGLVVRAMRGNSVKDGDEDDAEAGPGLGGGDRHAGSCWPLAPECLLTHPRPLAGTGVSSSAAAKAKTYCNNCYLDDDYGGFIVADRGPSTVPGGEEEEPLECAERLRETYVRGTIEQGGLKVVADAKSAAKHSRGEAGYRKRVLGIMIDVSDPLNPTNFLPEDKMSELRMAVAALHRSTDTSLPFGVVESLVHRLHAAAIVTERGRVYLCGFFAALRQADSTGMVSYSPWLRRNIRWWHKFFEMGGPPTTLFVPRPALAKKYCPHTDASTSWGFGGFWITGDTCYYIQGAWTPTEHRLIEAHSEVGIAFLEMATVDMLLAAAETIGFDADAFDFYCDNMNTVSLLNSYRSRTLPLSVLLESIDHRVAGTGHTIRFRYINTHANVESDALSRNALSEFTEFIGRIHDIHTIVLLQVPDEVRNIERTALTFIEHPEWIVLDGDVGPVPGPG